jgi:hypothetical protein
MLSRLPSAVAFIRGALDEDKGDDGRLKETSSWTRRGNRVLVHCVMGISRSSTVVCAYCE